MSDRDDLIQPDRGQDAIAIHLVNKDGFSGWVKKLSGPQRTALAAQKFDGSGYQVGIVQGHKLKIYADGNYRLLITTVVKPFRAPLSVLDLASAIVLPATFRSIGLGASWYLADKDLSGGCGCHVDMGTVDAPDMGQNLTVVLDSNICDAATARTWVEQQIQTIEGAHRQAA